ncbi:hypothetical protein CKO51_12375 [Rhodopirellula sp. SM50]|nr:hypothetical protein [Rhodopirellula sp. SM50]PAY19152.1 hypothetical protein CKO51_12375 [Rhodopirellula sp. SM50]
MYRVFLVCAAVTALTAVAVFSNPLDADDATNDREQERKARLEYLTQQAKEFKMSPANQQDVLLSIEERPVLRYTNPVRNFFTDGVVFLWRHESEPAVLGALSVRGNGNVFCEFASLTATPLHCDLGLQRPWTPEKKSQVDVPLKVRIPDSDDERRQKLAMRQLIRRFSVWMYEVENPDQKKELRLLTNPLVQWSDSAGQSSAMCFGFAETNDPEALVLLRYTPKSNTGGGTWTYTLSRMTSRPLVFELDQRMIHEVKAYWQNPQSVKDDYLERSLGEYPTN